MTLSSLRKPVLIQMASGPHAQLLKVTHDHHRSYAESHGMDYWCCWGLPIQGKRAGWGKVQLLVSALEMGYETVIWLDADAMIVRPEIDLGNVLPSGIGMVHYPNPEHWNSGVIILRASAEVLRFFREVNAAPENQHAWMEQVVINELASEPVFAPLIHALDLSYNSVPAIPRIHQSFWRHTDYHGSPEQP